MFVNETSYVIIGGTALADRNVISDNSTAGIGLFDDTTGTLVQGNLIGTDGTGVNPLGNGIGVQIDGGSSNNTIGGSVAAAGNTIAFSTGIGVDVDATAGTGNEIRLNSIFSSGSLGISLGGSNSVLLNGSAGTVGPNDYQAFPVLTSVASSGGTTSGAFTLEGTPNTTFIVDFYTISSITASGYGEGRYVLGWESATTSGAGSVSLPFSFPTPATGGEYVTATATDPSGNTSEFSKELGVDHPPTAELSFSAVTVNEGTAVQFDGSGSFSPVGARSLIPGPLATVRRAVVRRRRTLILLRASTRWS